MNHRRHIEGFLATKTILYTPIIMGVEQFEWEPHIFSEAFINRISDLEIPEKLMLGKRAERYFSALVNQSSDYDMLAENVQVISEKQTFGEFDFFVRRKSETAAGSHEPSQILHVELVYKFYLFDPSIEGTEFQKWIGPNKGDRLDFKLEKLEKHQFPLLFNEAASNTLDALNIDPKEVVQHVFFLGNLFVPNGVEVPFDEVNEACVEGTWQRLDEWENADIPGDLYAIPTKNEWFLRELDHVTWLSFEEAQATIQSHHQRQKSPLVWKKNADEIQSRSFVVWW